MNINTIIFDLGGVIIDLHERATVEAFIAISNKSAAEVAAAYQSSEVFKLHEKGLITNDEFRKGLRQLLEVDVDDNQLDEAWNAMLGKLPVERLNFLNKLQEKYKILILSNTNDIHEPAFTQIIRESSGKDSLWDFAHEVYYSHQLNLRKPDREIYQKVLELSDTQAAEALFLDDKKENLEGAESVGIHTMHITSPDQIFTLEKYVG